MSKIKTAFKNGNAFIPFITCGDPDLETTDAAVRAAAKNGADIIQLGIPFSDPTAEGPAIQSAGIRALKAGITTDRIFDFVRELRREVDVPLIFTTYANVVFSYGAERFISACREIGVDGLILPDLPFEERDEFLPVCRKYGVALISVVTPVSGKRIPMIAKEAEGFVFMASAPAARNDVENAKDSLVSALRSVRNNSELPCAVSFDYLAPEDVKNIVPTSDGVIVDSEIASLLEKYGPAAPAHIGNYVRSIKNALTEKNGRLQGIAF